MCRQLLFQQLVLIDIDNLNSLRLQFVAANESIKHPCEFVILLQIAENLIKENEKQNNNGIGCSHEYLADVYVNLANLAVDTIITIANNSIQSLNDSKIYSVMTNSITKDGEDTSSSNSESSSSTICKDLKGKISYAELDVLYFAILILAEVTAVGLSERLVMHINTSASKSRILYVVCGNGGYHCFTSCCFVTNGIKC